MGEIRGSLFATTSHAIVARLQATATPVASRRVPATACGLQGRPSAAITVAISGRVQEGISGVHQILLTRIGTGDALARVGGVVATASGGGTTHGRVCVDSGRATGCGGGVVICSGGGVVLLATVASGGVVLDGV